MDGQPESTPPNTGPGKTAHLDPWKWKPGQSGNPGGRPSDRSLRRVLEAVLEADDAAEAKALIRNLLEIAKGGGKQAVAAQSLVFEQYEPPLVKERVTTNTHVIQSITLEDRGSPVPIPGVTEEPPK